MIGSGPSNVEVETNTPEEVPGWSGRYKISGKAYLDFNGGRAVKEFEVETENSDGRISCSTITVK